jgi:hypothetical protein
MDPNKKFLHFNLDEADSESGGSQQNAVTVPVSTFAGMETTTTSNLRMFFKESVETDTLDITLLRTSDSNPRDLMEHIVNEINFSNNAVITIADDFTGETIHPDVKQMTGVEFAAHSQIVFSKRVTVISDTINASGADITTSGRIGNYNSEVATTIFVDFTDGPLHSSATGDQVIGKENGSDCKLTIVNKLKNGVIYRGEMICLKPLTGGDDVIELARHDSQSKGEGDGSGLTTVGTALTADTAGKSVSFDVNQDLNGKYLHLIHTGTSPDGDYTGGQILIRLFGAKEDAL